MTREWATWFSASQLSATTWVSVGSTHDPSGPRFPICRGETRRGDLLVLLTGESVTCPDVFVVFRKMSIQDTLPPYGDFESLCLLDIRQRAQKWGKGGAKAHTTTYGLSQCPARIPAA